MAEIIKSSSFWKCPVYILCQSLCFYANKLKAIKAGDSCQGSENKEHRAEGTKAVGKKIFLCDLSVLCGENFLRTKIELMS